MRFIKKWSYGCANYLMRKQRESHEKRGVYYYGFQIIIGSMVKAFLVIIISLLAGSLIPALLIIGIFGSLRMLAGGYHMDTYGRCIATSLALFIISSIISQYSFKYWNDTQLIVLIIATFIFSFAAAVKWAPSDNPNRPITKPEEIKKFRKLTLLYEIIWISVSFAFMYFRIWEYRMLLIAGSFGINLEIITITPAGFKFFNLVKGQFNKIGKQKKPVTHKPA